MNLGNILKNYESNVDYGDLIINNLENDIKNIYENKVYEEIDHNVLDKYEKINRKIQDKYSYIKIRNNDCYNQVINLINLNLIYLNENIDIRDIEYRRENNSIIENLLLSYFIGENPYIVIKNGEISIAEEKKLLKNITNTFGIIKYFSIGDILEIILPQEIKKHIKNYKRNIPKDIKNEINNINNITLSIDKNNIISHKNQITEQYLARYTDEIKEILKNKGIDDSTLLNKYAEKLNKSLYAFAGVSEFYTK